MSAVRQSFRADALRGVLVRSGGHAAVDFPHAPPSLARTVGVFILAASLPRDAPYTASGFAMDRPCAEDRQRIDDPAVADRDWLDSWHGAVLLLASESGGRCGFRSHIGCMPSTTCRALRAMPACRLKMLWCRGAAGLSLLASPHAGHEPLLFS